MKSFMLYIALFLVMTVPCSAHFVYVLPDQSEQTFRVVFSDELAPDKNVPIEKIQKTELFVTGVDGATSPLDWKQVGSAFSGKLPASDPLILQGITTYGWVKSRHTGQIPTVIYYHPKAISGDFRLLASVKPAQQPVIEIQPKWLNGKLRLQAFFHGKPLADASCAVVTPGSEKAEYSDTDSEGFLPGEFDLAGRYGAQVKAIDPAPGEYEGQQYDKIHHWGTLVLDLTPAMLKQ